MSLSHVEALAQKQSKYINLFELYANDLRKNITQGKEAYDRTLQEWDVLLKPAERPSLTHQEPKALQKAMEEICSMEPRSLEDRVKIMSAAHAMTNSIILYDMRNLTDDEQSQVNKRVTQLVQQSLPPRDTLPFQSALQKPQYPLNVVSGQRYSLQLLNKVLTYEIRSVVLDGDNSRYKIKYEEEGEDAEEEELGPEGMLNILGCSVLLPSLL